MDFVRQITMKPSDKNRTAFKKQRSYQDTMNYLNSRLEKYDISHENFVVPWQMVEKKKKEHNF